MGLRLSLLNSQLDLDQVKLVCYYLALLSVFLFCNIFPIIDYYRFLFTSGIGPDILVNVLQDRILLLISVSWFIFNFYLKIKNNGCQSGTLLKMSRVIFTIFWHLLMVEQIFILPQVKRSMIISKKLVFTSCQPLKT